MINLAVLGFGTVGSGVVEVIEGSDISDKVNEKVAVKKILDIRDFPESPYRDKLTKDFDEILNDDEIKIVAETMGGITFAYDYTKRCILAGKSVVTSNKELVATHGVELMRLARENGGCYMFEASVGGGIPIIRPLIQSLVADEITEIMGILNGTTNYILTQMLEKGESFDAALKKAQDKGYAERNPEADVEGHDTCRKIAILTSLVSGKHLDSNKIKTEGITKISIEDIKAADKEGCVIKLLGHSVKNPDGSFTANVSPVKIPKTHPLAGVSDVFNAILVKGSITGDVMFYGKGAGMLPTASAVVADIADIIKNGNTNAPYWEE